MLTQCPNCKTTYHFDEEKVEDMDRVLCPTCNDVFAIPKILQFPKDVEGTKSIQESYSVVVSTDGTLKLSTEERKSKKDKLTGTIKEWFSSIPDSKIQELVEQEIFSLKVPNRKLAVKMRQEIEEIGYKVLIEQIHTGIKEEAEVTPVEEQVEEVKPVEVEEMAVETAEAEEIETVSVEGETVEKTTPIEEQVEEVVPVQIDTETVAVEEVAEVETVSTEEAEEVSAESTEAEVEVVPVSIEEIETPVAEKTSETVEEVSISEQPTEIEAESPVSEIEEGEVAVEEVSIEEVPAEVEEAPEEVTPEEVVEEVPEEVVEAVEEEPLESVEEVSEKPQEIPIKEVVKAEKESAPSLETKPVEQVESVTGGIEEGELNSKEGDFAVSISFFGNELAKHKVCEKLSFWYKDIDKSKAEDLLTQIQFEVKTPTEEKAKIIQKELSGIGCIISIRKIEKPAPPKEAPVKEEPKVEEKEKEKPKVKEVVKEEEEEPETSFASVEKERLAAEAKKGETTPIHKDIPIKTVAPKPPEEKQPTKVEKVESIPQIKPTQTIPVKSVPTVTAEKTPEKITEKVPVEKVKPKEEKPTKVVKKEPVKQVSTTHKPVNWILIGLSTFLILIGTACLIYGLILNFSLVVSFAGLRFSPEQPIYTQVIRRSDENKFAFEPIKLKTDEYYKIQIAVDWQSKIEQGKKIKFILYGTDTRQGILNNQKYEKSFVHPSIKVFSILIQVRRADDYVFTLEFPEKSDYNSLPSELTLVVSKSIWIASYSKILIISALIPIFAGLGIIFTQIRKIL